MTRYDLLDIRAALDKASYWARKQADLFQIIDAKKKVEALLNEPSLPSNLDKAAKEYACEYTENDNGNGGEDWEDDIRITFMAGAEWMAKQLPLPEDSVAFQKGVQEGRRLEREDALTISDIEMLHALLYAVKNNKQLAFTFTSLSDEQYEEVLRRFNNAKEK